MYLQIPRCTWDAVVARRRRYISIPDQRHQSTLRLLYHHHHRLLTCRLLYHYRRRKLTSQGPDMAGMVNYATDAWDNWSYMYGRLRERRGRK
jgi:hypothetical protein